MPPPRSRLRRFTCALLALGVASLFVLASTEVARSDHPLPPPARISRLVVRKAAHRLEAYDGNTLVATLRVAIGVGGRGPKVYEGDNRTPEGRYRIDRRHVSARFHRFLHVSYPNDADRRRHREARSRGDVPRDIGIGHSIGIHGEPDFPFARLVTRRTDWTAGCIAVQNDEIEWLFESVTPGAELRILP